jgi:phage FluMu protein Com
MKWKVWDARCLQCSAFLIETPGPLCMPLTCPDCLGVNIFRDSTTPVEYLFPPQTRQEAASTNRTDIGRKTAIGEHEQDAPQLR